MWSIVSPAGNQDEQPDLMALLHDGLGGSVRHRRE
jgi:hypothetical protein